MIGIGDIFPIDMRNLNISAKSCKEGMVYFGKFEMTEDDFDRFRGVDLTGSCFVAQIEVVSISAEKPKGGSLSKSAARICEQPAFHAFVRTQLQADGTVWSIELTNEEVCAQYMRDYCGIQSRAELDHNQEAEARLKQLMKDFREFQGANP